jgi:hypothetical protein
VTSLKLTITAVSSTTKNIGLAEIQTYTGGGSLSGLNPTSGKAGSSASATVTGFLPSAPLSVTVGGIAAAVSSGGTTNTSGGSTVIFTIPAVAAGAQPVVVSDGSDSATAPFTVVTGSSPPAVSGLSPTSGQVGSSASVTASGFLAAHALTVTVGGSAATISAGGTTGSGGGATVTFTIPNVAAGAQPVVVSDGTNSAASPTQFTVTVPPPPAAVSGLSPTSGQVGSSASVTASGFLAAHALTVTVGGSAATISAGGTTGSGGGSTVTFTIPNVAAGAQPVVVSDGTNSAASPTQFTVTVPSAPPGGTNVAPLATVTASSENASTGQTAAKAVDGSTLGYPQAYQHEWATVGQGAGAWLNLAWSSPQTLTSITLYDRPNLDDQVTGGTITFSDGSTLAVGVLPNDGSPYTLTFAAKTVTSLKLTITAVSSTTQNIGLAEIQTYTG